MDTIILLQSVVNGLMMGGVYALLAVGLTLIFGVMNVVNFSRPGESPPRSWNPRGKPQREQTLQEVFDLFPRLQERAHQSAGTLSGGEQQMLALGRALMQSPLLLMLDEPSLGLAPVLVEAVFETLGRIMARGVSILLVEQNIFYAIELASRSYLLENGRISLEGPRVEFTENPHIQEAYLGM